MLISGRYGRYKDCVVLLTSDIVDCSCTFLAGLFAWSKVRIGRDRGPVVLYVWVCLVTDIVDGAWGRTRAIWFVFREEVRVWEAVGGREVDNLISVFAVLRGVAVDPGCRHGWR